MMKSVYSSAARLDGIDGGGSPCCVCFLSKKTLASIVLSLVAITTLSSVVGLRVLTFFETTQK